MQRVGRPCKAQSRSPLEDGSRNAEKPINDYFSMFSTTSKIEDGLLTAVSIRR